MKIITKEETINDELVDVEYVELTTPAVKVEHKKEDYIAELKQRLAIYQSEVARNQEMVDGLQAELDSFK